MGIEITISSWASRRPSSMSFWDPDRTVVPLEKFRSRVAEAAAPPAWIIDGNDSPVRDLVWPRAHRRRREFPEFFKRPEYAHRHVFELTQPRHANSLVHDYDDWSPTS